MTLENFLTTLTEAKKQRLEDLGFTPEEFVDAYNEHSSKSGDELPSVYCGTYAKYNEGSLYGQWIDLTSFGGDYDEFITYCQALHADEQDPELMFQDYENFLDEWYNECPSKSNFDNIIEYSNMCEQYPKEAIDAYVQLTGKIDLEDFREIYQGQWAFEEDFAEYLITECYSDSISKMPSIIANNIDWKSIARELFMSDYDFVDCYVFRR